MTEHPIVRVNGKDHPDPIGTAGPVITRYRVLYTIKGTDDRLRRSDVVLSEGYSDFSHITKILAIPAGVDATDIIVETAEILR